MKKSFLECEGPGCKNIWQLEPATYGSKITNWITLQKMISGHGELLTSGEHHFCCDTCLMYFMSQDKERE